MTWHLRTVFRHPLEFALEYRQAFGYRSLRIGALGLQVTLSREGTGPAVDARTIGVHSYYDADLVASWTWVLDLWHDDMCSKSRFDWTPEGRHLSIDVVDLVFGRAVRREDPRSIRSRQEWVVFAMNDVAHVEVTTTRFRWERPRWFASPWRWCAAVEVLQPSTGVEVPSHKWSDDAIGATYSVHDTKPYIGQVIEQFCANVDDERRKVGGRDWRPSLPDYNVTDDGDKP